MNELIETIFKDLAIEGIGYVPVSFLYYEGHGEPYVTYQQVDADNVLAGDDGLMAYVDYYDFDIYSKGNYNRIIDTIKSKLIANGFVFQVSSSSGDFYETDTGYYHKTLNFAIIREDNINGKDWSEQLSL
jgi:hypothetical protein